MPLRSIPRYFLIPPLFATAGRESVRVVDISLRGARLELNAPLPVGSRQRVVIATTNGTVDEEVTVLWSQIDDISVDGDVDRYVAGVEFESRPGTVGELIEKLLVNREAVPIEDSRTADRFRLSVPMTGVIGMMQARVVDLSIRGARIALRQFTPVGTITPFAFQVDAAGGPLEVMATVAWCIGTAKEGYEAGLKIDAEEERMRAAIHRLCMRDEAQIDLHSLRRKFDALREATLAAEPAATF
ncbi:MAG TPA: PilZ domain-containing protein [Thermoanaerobaculia bacterium]|nr:PilZ domain-containing protein [Thermoanaerobaculia bacterium]